LISPTILIGNNPKCLPYKLGITLNNYSFPIPILIVNIDNCCPNEVPEKTNLVYEGPELKMEVPLPNLVDENMEVRFKMFLAVHCGNYMNLCEI